MSVAWNNDGTKLASGSYDKTVRIWSVGSVGTVECESTLTVGSEVTSVAFSPDGELVEFVATDDIFTTNIAWGGDDMMDAYICLSGSGRLVKTRWARPGLKLQY